MLVRAFALLAAAGISLIATIAIAAGPQQDAALRGATFIASTQQADGGFGGFGPGQSFDAILALRAAGFDPNTAITGGNSPADYLAGIAPTLDGAGIIAKAALAAEALGLDPRDTGGTDLIAALDAAFDPATGRYAGDPFNQALAVIGKACTGTPVPSGALAALRADRIAGAGWGFGGASDPDTTAIALQALLAAGSPIADANLQQAIAYLRAAQGADGGWGFDPAGPSNTSSTAFVLQALLAAGEMVDSPAYAKDGGTPIAFLLSQQAADGSFAGFDPAFATNQVVPALTGKTFCNAATTVATAALPGPANPPLPPATGSGLRGEDAASGGDIALAAALLVAMLGLAAQGPGRRPRR